MCNRILTAETILPIESEPLYNSSVVISGDRIIDIGPKDHIRKRYEKFSETDLGKGILLPGFINGHVHLELGWIKNKIGSFKNFTQWLNQIINSKADEGLTDETIKQSVRDGLSVLIKTGVSTVGEISSYSGLDKELVINSGLRAIIFEELFDRHIGLIDEKKYVIENIVETRPFPHAPYSCSPELLKKIFDMSIKNDIAIGIHLAESEDETSFVKNEFNNIEDQIYPLIKKEKYERPVAESPFDYIKKYDNALQTGLTIIHAVHLSDKEIDEISEKKIGVIVCPRSNLYLNVGTPPLAKLTELERLGLATDGLSSNHSLDYFEEMATLYNLLSDLNICSPSSQTVYCATLGGAKALFIEDMVGSVEIDKMADLIFISYDEKPDDPYLHVISAGSDRLGMNMVNGRIIYSSIDKLNHGHG